MAEARTNTRFINEIKRTDELIERFIADIARVFEMYLSQQYDEFLDDDPDAVLTTLRTAKLPRRVQEKIELIVAIYESELDNLRGRFAISDNDKEFAQEFAALEIAGITSLLIETKQKISSRLALTQDDTPSRSEIFETSVAPIWSKIKTTLVTDTSGYRSHLEISKAKEVSKGEPRFAYVGPNDEKTREFCRRIITQQPLYTFEEIKALDKLPDVQLTPVFIYGGGYNCRHRWIFTERR